MVTRIATSGRAMVDRSTMYCHVSRSTGMRAAYDRDRTVGTPVGTWVREIPD